MKRFFMAWLFLIGGLTSCQKEKANFVVNGGEYFSVDEHEALNELLDAHMRTKALPIFIWLPHQNETTYDFEAFTAGTASLKHIKKAVVLMVNLHTNEVAIFAHESIDGWIAPEEQNRILQEVLRPRLDEGFLFEGVWAAGQELTAILEPIKL